MKSKGLKLCYVKNPWAYFTTQSLDDQWGDDWEDAPYEYNSGVPYEPCWHNKPGSSKYPCDCGICKREWHEDGTPKWEIEKIAFDIDCITKYPHSGYRNSPYSVKQINDKEIPWIRIPSKGIEIYAGTALEEFEEQLSGVKHLLFFEQHITGKDG